MLLYDSNLFFCLYFKILETDTIVGHGQWSGIKSPMDDQIVLLETITTNIFVDVYYFIIIILI